MLRLNSVTIKADKILAVAKPSEVEYDYGEFRYAIIVYLGGYPMEIFYDTMEEAQKEYEQIVKAMVSS
jgi:hypothetical protein